MTDKTELAAKLQHFEELMAASEKKVAALEAKIADATKLAEGAPFKSDWKPPANPTDRAAMPQSVRQEIAKTFDANLVAGLRSDAHPNAYYSGGEGGASRSVGEPEVKRGSGWVEPRKLEGPPGIAIMDQMMDRQDELDRADLARRLSRSGTSKDQPK